MKVAVMQPYIFPYIGYFQLINAVDKFVFYDDVNFIKKGWINRNRILVNSNDFVFTVPLNKVSQNNLINETLINAENFEKWKQKFIQTLTESYKKAPFFRQTYELVDFILSKNYQTISELASESVKLISNYIGIETVFLNSSETYHNKGLEKQTRLIDICRLENANHYINALGGQELYKKEDFSKQGIKLDFIKSLPVEYKQFNEKFVPWLSIIDVMMFNSQEEIQNLLTKYELI